MLLKDKKKINVFESRTPNPIVLSIDPQWYEVSVPTGKLPSTIKKSRGTILKISRPKSEVHNTLANLS